MAKRVLLTGGTGFVGANLVRHLLADGHRVHLLVRPGFSSWRLEGIRSHVQLHQAALDDPTLDAVVRRIRPDWVFHLAAQLRVAAAGIGQERGPLVETQLQRLMEESFDFLVLRTHGTNTGSILQWRRRPPNRLIRLPIRNTAQRSQPQLRGRGRPVRANSTLAHRTTPPGMVLRALISPGIQQTAVGKQLKSQEIWRN